MPVQEPEEAVKVWPSIVVPDSDGSEVFTGAAVTEAVLSE
jgi:hypothetical protein